MSVPLSPNVVSSAPWPPRTNVGSRGRGAAAERAFFDRLDVGDLRAALEARRFCSQRECALRLARRDRQRLRCDVRGEVRDRDHHRARRALPPRQIHREIQRSVLDHEGGRLRFAHRDRQTAVGRAFHRIRAVRGRRGVRVRGRARVLGIGAERAASSTKERQDGEREREQEKRRSTAHSPVVAHCGRLPNTPRGSPRRFSR